MNNECGNKHTTDHPSHPVTYRCNRERGHAGDHKGWSTPSRWSYKIWPQRTFTPQTFFITDAELKENKKYQDWLNKEMDKVFASVREAPYPEERSVLLTLEDLKTLSYYLPFYTDDAEDQDNITKAKIDAALKKML